MGGFISAIGDTQKADAERKIAGIYTQEAGQNRQLGNLAAADAIRRGVQQAGAVDLKTAQVAGAQTAGYAASGVDAGSGSALDAMADTRMMSQYDKDVIANNAAREAWGYKVKGMQAYQQGLLNAAGARIGASNAEYAAAGNSASAVMQLGTTFLGAAG